MYSHIYVTCLAKFNCMQRFLTHYFAFMKQWSKIASQTAMNSDCCYLLPLSLHKRFQLFPVTLNHNPEVVSSVFSLIERKHYSIFVEFGCGTLASWNASFIDFWPWSPPNFTKILSSGMIPSCQDSRPVLEINRTYVKLVLKYIINLYIATQLWKNSYTCNNFPRSLKSCPSGQPHKHMGSPSW